MVIGYLASDFLDTYSDAPPRRECKKSKLPKVPVTNGGAVPFGVLMRTATLGGKTAQLNHAQTRLTLVSNMAEDITIS